MKNKEGEKQHEHHNDKINVCNPDGFFALRLIVQYIVGHHEEDPEMLQKALRSMICFFMTACATTFYKGKGDFTPFTLNARGVVSLIMLITTFKFDFISMWVDWKEKM